MLHLRLLLVLISGLAAYALHRAVLAALSRRLSPRAARPLSVLVVVLLAAGIAGAALGPLPRLLGDAGTYEHLSQRLADTLDQLRATLPEVLASRLPDSADALRAATTAWAKAHLGELRSWGGEALRTLADLLIGLVVGLLVSAAAVDDARGAPPSFLQGWRHGLARLADAFSRIVTAQVRIAALNTALTAVFVYGVVRALGEALPLPHALVALTFVAGMLPVVGNLLSNTVLVLAALTVSPTLALCALGFLVAIHKLEYFLNARFVGARIGARAYELLAAMVAMEAAFGVAGLVAAPIYYAWLKAVLQDEGLI